MSCWLSGIAWPAQRQVSRGEQACWLAGWLALCLDSVPCHCAGKAGGFLARDWNDNSPLGPLSRHSFILHQELAERFGADVVGYRWVVKGWQDGLLGTLTPSPPASLCMLTHHRRVHTLSVAGKEEATSRPRAPGLPDWVDGTILRSGVRAHISFNCDFNNDDNVNTVITN